MATYGAWLVVEQGPPSHLKLGSHSQRPCPKTTSSSKCTPARSTPRTPRFTLMKLRLYLVHCPSGYGFMTLPKFLAGRPHIAGQDVAGIIVDAKGTEFGVGYKALVNQLKIESRQTVFINSGSSSVGLSGIQIAKSLGCKVVATASAKNKDLLLSLGVDEFIDYTQAPLVEQFKAKPPSPKCHALFDAVGLTDPALYLNSAAYLAPGGTYLTAGTLPKTRKEILGMLRQAFEGLLRPTWLGGVPRKYGVVMVTLKNKDLETVRELVAKGAVKPIVDSVHSFDRDGVLRAHEKIMSKRAVGKVVVKVADEEWHTRSFRILLLSYRY
ncbi:NAD(P)-binding protein [Mycena maculata]|uniref:NAD(P)-binding protein n=1 Tax=Mycena maculata TaxID=230809 RepID=A0AAD7NMN2_9AGAR|nr:NAD(P)-binding protein [Mycena maculata]